MPISNGGFNLPDIECSDIIVGHTSLLPLGIPASSPIFEAKYEIVIRNIHITLPAALTRIFVKGSRCG
jgi:hypothetical protein